MQRRVKVTLRSRNFSHLFDDDGGLLTALVQYDVTPVKLASHLHLKKYKKRD